MKTFAEAKHASFEAPVVVLFTSPACGPCKAMKPVLAGLAERLQFPYVELSVTEHMDDLLQLGSRAVPTMVVLKNGASVGVFMGGRSEAQIREILDEHEVTQQRLEF